MKTINNANIYELLKRIRKSSFVILVSFSVLCAYFMVPNSRLPITSIVIAPQYFAQISDASWIPIAASICSGIFLPLIGVLYLKNSLTEDCQTGVFSLIRTSSIHNFQFLMCRFLVNLELMCTILAVTMIGSYIMICTMFSAASISIQSFFTPFLTIVPGLIFSSAIAVLLDSISLRFRDNGESVGLLLFLAGYIAVLTISVLPLKKFTILFDFFGIQWIIYSINQTVIPVTGENANITILAGGDAIQNSAELPRLVFQGIVPSEYFLYQKIALCIISIFLILLASIILTQYVPYKKFKTSRLKNKKIKAKVPQRTTRNYTSSKLSCLYALYFRNIPKAWWIVLAGLLCISAAAPLNIAEDILIPLLFGWSFRIFSHFGCIEYTYHMEIQTLCLPNAYIRHLRISTVSAIVYAILITSPISIRCLFTREFYSLAAILALAIFISSLSVLLGEITHDARPAEIILLFLCFFMLNEPSIIIGISKEYYTFTRTILIYFISIGMISVTFLKRYLRSR